MAKGIARLRQFVCDLTGLVDSGADEPAISIHAYGANIGAVARHVFVAQSGEAKPFVSGYANRLTPNLWDRSTETRERLGI